MECGYLQEYIGGLEFRDALKMGDYWDLEPPVSWLTKVYWGFGKKEEESFSEGQPFGQGLPFNKLPKALQQMEIKHWLGLNAGKTELDFYKQIEKKRLERYADKLKAAREKKNG